MKKYLLIESDFKHLQFVTNNNFEKYIGYVIKSIGTDDLTIIAQSTEVTKFISYSFPDITIKSNLEKIENDSEPIVILNWKFPFISRNSIHRAIGQFSQNTNIQVQISISKWDVLPYHSLAYVRQLHRSWVRINNDKIESDLTLNDIKSDIFYAFYFWINGKDSVDTKVMQVRFHGQELISSSKLKFANSDSYIRAGKDKSIFVDIKETNFGKAEIELLEILDSHNENSTFIPYELYPIWCTNYKGWINLKKGGELITGRQNVPVMYKKHDALTICRVYQLKDISQFFISGNSSPFILAEKESLEINSNLDYLRFVLKTKSSDFNKP